MALTEAAYYDFFRKIVLQPDGVTLEADHTRDELTITRGAGVAFNPVEGTDSFEIDVDYSLYVPIGSTSVTLRDVNANESNISITAGSNIVVSRVSDNELEIIATVGGASKSISNISATNPVVVTTTSSHSYTEGSEVTITDVIGMTEVNGNEYYMDILTGDTFALYSDPLLTTPIDGTLFTPYSTGGVATADYTAVKTMSGLTDTTITTPQNNDLIAYSNGIWVNTNSITATLTGDVTGNVTGDVTGDVTGNVTGDVTGDVTGNVTGNLDGIVGGTTPAAGTFTELRTSETAIALGLNAGGSNQGSDAVAIGNNAGYITQGAAAIAIGDGAGRDSQDTLGIAIGNVAGNSNQGNAAIAIGAQAGNSNQSGQNAIAIGTQAGWFSQSGDNSIAIGYRAGMGNQHANTIILNSSGGALNSNGTDRLFVKPIRQTDSPYYLKYDDTSGEVTYASASDFVVGDLQGSVFADDSTTLVDAVNSKIVGDVETASLKLSSTSPNFLITDTDGYGNGVTQTLEFKKYLQHGWQIDAVSNSGQGNLQIRADSGTYALSIYPTFMYLGVASIFTSTVNFKDDIFFEGSTDDSFETRVTVEDPTADNIITIPDATGTIALTSDVPATTDNLTEGSTNLYYTDARAQTATTGRAIAMSMIFGG